MSASAGRTWPGKGLGLPEEGPRSLARLGHRLGALAIDWAIAYAITFALFRGADPITSSGVNLLVFAAVTVVFELCFLGSPGHLLLRMRVVPERGGRLAPWKPFVRTLLLCLVIPVVVPDADRRGLHDRAAGTLLVRV